MEKILRTLPDRLSKAVAHYWCTREAQANKQKTAGSTDQGARCAVTGGAQMDGFITLMTEIIVDAGIDERFIFHNRHLELPNACRNEMRKKQHRH